MGHVLTTSADHGLIIGAGKGCVKRRGEGEMEGEVRLDQPLKGDPAVFEKKVEGATCVGIVDPWALIVSTLITWPFSWLWPANMRHASAHKRSPAYRRRATGKGESTHWVASWTFDKSIRLPKGKERGGATLPMWPLDQRSTEPLETLCACELDHHELDGCATRESRETQGELSTRSARPSRSYSVLTVWC